MKVIFSSNSLLRGSILYLTVVQCDWRLNVTGYIFEFLLANVAFTCDKTGVYLCPTPTRLRLKACPYLHRLTYNSYCNQYCYSHTDKLSREQTFTNWNTGSDYCRKLKSIIIIGKCGMPKIFVKKTFKAGTQITQFVIYFSQKFPAQW